MLGKIFKRKQTVEPFTNQFDMLMKSGQANNDQGQIVGMCQPMTNHYLDLILHNQDPTEQLKNGKQFFRESIIEENDELDFQKKKLGYDDHHHAFYKNNVAHQDQNYIFKDLTQENINKTLEYKKHMLMTFELDNSKAHEVYLGKKDRSTCRFFDANLNGGEWIKPCDELIPETLVYLSKTYSLDKSTPFKIGVG